jgi:hypothetical protein
MQSSRPNKEIIDSKVPAIRFSKQNGKQRLMLLERQKQNQQLMERLYAILHESREPGSREYAPGVRMNHQMIPVLDCYPTTLHVCKNFAKLHSHKLILDRSKKKIEKENEKFQQHLQNVKSPYAAEVCLKNYQRMKSLIEGVSKIPHTALHLLRASHPNSPNRSRARSASPKYH